ncbi:MAG: hypothetical protein Q7S55_04405 [Nanoarchaeota archaeon]|nr:hypothetical protein [Nanoarchaeota archaeon]
MANRELFIRLLDKMLRKIPKRYRAEIRKDMIEKYDKQHGN